MSIKEEMLISPLPGEMLIKGLARNIENNGYEVYLTEFINNSIYFRAKINFKEYVHQIEQSNSECDCVYNDNDNNYELDYKLLVSQSEMQVLRKTSNQLVKDIKTGSHLVKTQITEDNSPLPYIMLHSASRKCNEDYKIIEENQYKFNADEPDSNYEVKNMIRIMKTEKNLLLFLPYIFSFKSNYPLFQRVFYISQALIDSFGKALEYRINKVSGFDTFIAVIHQNLFIIYEYKNNSLTPVDYICTEKSNTFKELQSLPIL